jgi:hypothetical protein
MKSVITWLAMWGACVSATILITSLVTSVETRNDNFFLSVLAVLLAETITFMYPISLTLQREKNFINLPLHLGTGIMITIYDLGVACLFLLGLSQIPFTFLFTFHILWLLLLIILVGLSTITNLTFLNFDKKKLQKAPLVNIQNRFTSICQRLELLEGSETKKLSGAFSTFSKETICYATGESLPGSEGIESRIKQCIEDIDHEIKQIEKESNVKQSSDYSGNINMLEQYLSKLSLYFSQREELIKKLR